MERFIITQNQYLTKNIQAYNRFDYTGFGTQGNPDFINHLKNHFLNTPISTLNQAFRELIDVIFEDLAEIRTLNSSNMTVCVIPRAKSETFYHENQRLFKRGISGVVDRLGDFGYSNGLNFIQRHTNTRTTHMNRSGFGGEGEMPYKGITNATCTISSEVRGKDILLIDDIYTKGVNIDEDAIQALFDKGARKVVFYAVAKTYRNEYHFPQPQQPPIQGPYFDDLDGLEKLPF